jgi:hypothetical protein
VYLSVGLTDHWFTCAPARRATGDAARCLPRRTRSSAGENGKQRDAVAHAAIGGSAAGPTYAGTSGATRS